VERLRKKENVNCRLNRKNKENTFGKKSRR